MDGWHRGVGVGLGGKVGIPPRAWHSLGDPAVGEGSCIGVRGHDVCSCSVATVMMRTLEGCEFELDGSERRVGGVRSEKWDGGVMESQRRDGPTGETKARAKVTDMEAHNRQAIVTSRDMNSYVSLSAL